MRNLEEIVDIFSDVCCWFIIKCIDFCIIKDKIFLMGKGDRNGMDESLGVSYINVGLNLLVIGYMNLRKVFLKF